MLRGKFWRSSVLYSTGLMVKNLSKHKTLITDFCVLLMLIPLCIRLSFCSSQADAELAIQSAESHLLDCYEAIYEAERAGANVSNLLNVLNEAGWLLVKAKLAYNAGVFESAIGYALNCSQRLDGIVSQANSLKLEAEQASRIDFLINYVGSAAGSIAILVVGYVAWFFLKKREVP